MARTRPSSQQPLPQPVTRDRMGDPRIVNCPRCATPVPWTPQSRFRPFCSERCKLIDLGDWAAERYRIAGVEPPDPGLEDEGASTPPRDD